MVNLGEGAHRADCDALAAEDAVGVDQILTECGGNHCGESAVNSADSTYGLVLVAYSLATTAHDALVLVAYDRRRKGNGVIGLSALVGDLTDAHFSSESLKLALAALCALEAVVRVIGEHKLEDGLARVDGAERVGLHNHIRHTFGDAGRSKVAAAGYLYDAYAASAGMVLEGEAFELEVTEGRNLDTHLCSSFQNGSTLGHFHCSVVYSQFDSIHIVFLPYLMLIAPNLHFS